MQPLRSFTIISFLSIFQSTESGLALVFSTFMSFVNIFGCIFVFCYLGDGVTEHYNRIGLTLCQCKWYSFPAKIQRKLVPVLILTQRPRVISGLSIILCTIENFTAVRFTTSSSHRRNINYLFCIFRSLKAFYRTLWRCEHCSEHEDKCDQFFVDE